MAYSDGRALAAFRALHSHLSKCGRFGRVVLDWGVRLSIRVYAYSSGISSSRFSRVGSVAREMAYSRSQKMKVEVRSIVSLPFHKSADEPTRWINTRTNGAR